ncbi:MAG: 2-dehydro-3-deoxyphosphogluconate aldolase/(4S)-4-hydroxy-2-oxoglutarate aldolase [Saprospiraceae bacterium]|jgi:2-dehydro-3-deoxyphosphogluconate aldolase/(4S)-4-hydroxy-2-oxoglutarate aldolase
MTRETILSIILQTKIVAIIRLNNSAPVYHIAEALYEGGVKAIEVTMGTPNALAEIKKLAKHPGILPGVGSVLDAATAEQAILAGAEFIVTPVSKLEVIEMAHRYGKPILSGALTPKEILQAYEWGADIVKLFPAATFGIPYFKAVRAPMPQIPIMPTGGITLENAAEWIKNGAVCLGVGSTLVNEELIADQDFKAITAIAKRLYNDAINLSFS